jgi:hypothetical protein
MARQKIAIAGSISGHGESAGAGNCGMKAEKSFISGQKRLRFGQILPISQNGADEKVWLMGCLILNEILQLAIN